VDSRKHFETSEMGLAGSSVRRGGGLGCKELDGEKNLFAGAEAENAREVFCDLPGTYATQGPYGHWEHREKGMEFIQVLEKPDGERKDALREGATIIIQGGGGESPPRRRKRGGLTLKTAR